MILEWVRWPIGQLILLLDRLTSPTPPQRTAEAQARVNRATQGMALYQFESCPFCVKTRRAMRRLGVDLETRDARRDPAWRQQLLDGGGRLQVPCLYVPAAQGGPRWMYESDDIIAFLAQRCAEAERAQAA